MSTFTRTSPTSAGEVPAGVTEIGGLVLDLIGTNGIRVVSQLAASSLFQGFYDGGGTPAPYNGNPGTIGIQTGLTPAIVAALGGGLSEVAVRLTLYDGDTSPSDFDDGDNTLLLNGISFSNFSTVDTQITSSDGLTVDNATTGFTNDRLNTGWFHSNDPTLLSNLFASISASNEVSFKVNDVDPYDNYFDFKQGIDGGLINVGSAPNVAPSLTVGVHSDLVEAGLAGPGVDTSVATLTKSDQETTATYNLSSWTLVSGTNYSKLGLYGTAYLDTATDHITYKLDNSLPSTEALNSGTVVHDVFSVTVTDGALDTTKNVDFLINGANDAVSSPVGGLIGGNGPDTLYGTNGGETLKGLRGDDTIFGNGGDDRVYGGDGHDTLYGNNGDDKVYGEVGDDHLYGGNGNDVLFGGVGNDKMYGEAGNDSLWSGAGDDLATGGIGDDSIWGEEGNDNLWGGDGNDSLVGGIGNDRVWGEAGNDRLFGNDGNDILVGGDGSDKLYGGEGSDNLFGNAGNDTFIFNAVSEIASDQISDFMVGDKIDLSGIDANSGTGANDAFLFSAAGVFSSVSGELIVVQDVPNGVTFVEGDVNGDGVADFQLKVAGLVILQATDFAL